MQVVVNQEENGQNQAKGVKDEEGTDQVCIDSVFELEDLQNRVDSVQIDEEGNQPQRLVKDVESHPVDFSIVVVMEVLVENDSNRNVDERIEHHQREEAIPDTNRVRMDVELVPLEVKLRQSVIFFVADLTIRV